MPLKITSPTPNTLFTITDDPWWPAIQFQTDATLTQGQRLMWDWKIGWDRFSKQGKDTTNTSFWNAQMTLFQDLTAGVITNLGGQLTVRVSGAHGSAHVTVRINGTNPTKAAILEYLKNQPNSDGFDKILEHESKMVHFNARGEPIKSFDNGYGIAQLTSPAPSYEKVWNWKLNISGGIELFQVKLRDAMNYLSQQNRSYTPDQLTREAVARWNGTSYHVWSGQAWVRPSTILCDTQTGNIGWDMTKAVNAGKTEAQLRARDKATYQTPGLPTNNWFYSGVCYADRILS